MDTKTLNTLFNEAVYKIPDYQRGYAWDEKQWKDFIQDVDAIKAENLTGHYTGTIVVFCQPDSKVDYGTERLAVKEVVDGQQRLTTACLYLSVILHALVDHGKEEYEKKYSTYLFDGTGCKIILNNDTENIFYDLLKTGRVNTEPRYPHEKRLKNAHEFFQAHVDQRLAESGPSAVEYLRDIYDAVTQKLLFTFYTVEKESEIGMTFELMNSRGKGLSVLELLKNYFMYWVYRNSNDDDEKRLTELINKYWKDTYINIGSCAVSDALGDEDQCLRVAWTLYCDSSPKNWKGYDGFKREDGYFPLRSFEEKSKEETRKFIDQFSGGLADVSGFYASIMSKRNTVSGDELLWLSKIHHSKNVSNFLPLLVAARKNRESGSITEENYIDLLKALECYAYRVFLHDSRRSSTGKAKFYSWGAKIFKNPEFLPEVIDEIHSLIQHYQPEKKFHEENSKPSNWYGSRMLLRYTLFEYELHLLKVDGKGKDPHLTWEQLNDSTFEHILPQNPKDDSHWMEEWHQTDIDDCLHDIGNLVLTQNNSNYLNFEFSRKKGEAGVSPSYSDSDIRQERKLHVFDDWTRDAFNQRREELVDWINTRWESKTANIGELQIDDEEDEDGLETINLGIS